MRGQNAAGNGPYSGSPGNYDSFTLQATSATPVLTLNHQSRTVVELSWTPAPAGSTYDLQRRRVVTSIDPTDPGTVTAVDGSSTDFARLPSALLTATSHTDSAANFVAPADTASVVHTVKYEYRVRAVDSADQEGDWSAVKSVTIPRSGTVLGAPTGLATSVLSSSNIRVSWNNVAGADHYEFQWKSGDRSFSTSITVNRPDSGNPAYNDTGLSPSTKYTYRVRGVDVNGPGDWSAEQPATTISVTAEAGQMPKVTGLTVTDETTSNTADERKAKLTWNAVSTATDYEIQRYDPSTTFGWQDLTNPTPSAGVTRIDAESSPSYTDTFADGSAAGKTFFYVVSAVEDGVDEQPGNADDEMGEWSDYKAVTFKAHKPNVPTGLTGVKTSGTSILVSWTAPLADNTGGAMGGLATTYTLRWRTAGSQTWTDKAVTGTSYHHIDLRGNTSYSYRVRAQNSGGESDWVDDLAPIVLGNTLSPPTGLRAVDATASDGTAGIKVSWNRVSGASSYEVQRFDTTDNPPMWGNFTGDNEQFETTTDTMLPQSSGLAAGMTYLYRVRTVTDSDAKSGWSAAVSGTTKASTATAPTLVATSTGMSMIRLSWTAVAGATGYEIEFLKGSYTGTDTDAITISALLILTGRRSRSLEEVTVTTGTQAVLQGTRYSYRIKAQMLAQGGETGWSNVAQQYTKPDRPVLTASSTISTTMVLTWDAVKFVAADGSDGRLATNERYQIQRRAATSSTWTTLIIGTDDCTNNKCTYSDAGTDLNPAGLTASTRYYYRIRANSDARDGTTYTSYWAYRNQQTSNR